MTKSLFIKPQNLQRAVHEENRQVEEEETARQAKGLHLPYVDLRSFPVDFNTLALFTKDEAEQAESLPFYRDAKDLRIATTNAGNALLAEKVAEFSKHYSVTLYLVSKGGLEETLRLYEKVVIPKQTQTEIIRVEEKVDPEKVLADLQKNEETDNPLLASEFLTKVFASAMALEASDIHFESEEKFFKIRFRLDGVLHDMLHLQKKEQKPLISRIKIFSKLKINVENKPQDGRLTFYYLGKPVDVRVASLPSGYGEGLVLRLLTTEASKLKFSDLGLGGRNKAVVETALNKPNGMMLTCGPTGSGKTTTLYAFLNELNDPGVKIITLEDPIEYKLEGVQQTPIDHRVNFNFADGLRAILRQDPDIVMVGEIRDQETAETALQAALTGHVVLSTLHTNDAVGAVPRLLQMGVKSFVIGPAMNAIIAQRLVRKLCVYCKKPAQLSGELKTRVAHLLQSIPEKSGVAVPKNFNFFSAPGCQHCHKLGYKGRIGIFEVIEINEGMEALILKDPTTTEIRKLAVQDGMITMAQDGLLKALEGITDVEEVFRVAEG